MGWGIKVSILNKLKIFLLTLVAVLSFILSVIHSKNVYGGIKFDFDHAYNDKGGGTTKKQIKLWIDDKDKDEIQNFTTVSQSSVQGYNCVGSLTLDRPTLSSNYEDIDNIIYMVKLLEKYAEPISYDLRKNINNYVLGYIRGINKNYTGESERSTACVFDKSFWGFDYWQVVAGLIDCDFTKKVWLSEVDVGITPTEFFSSFLSSEEDYNYYLHHSLLNSRKNNQKLADPLGSGQKIDLLHMIASIDGVYEHTQNHDTTCKVMLGSNHFQRDVVTWLGDLQTLAYDVGKKVREINTLKNYSSEMGHIDFNDFISNQTGQKINDFSSDDLLADIDAFNITNFFLNSNLNSLSDSIIGYYTTMNSDGELKGNRYYAFIYNVTRELNQPSTGNMEQDFRNEVCNAMNVKYENGVYSDCKYFSGYNIKLLDDAKNKFAARKYCAQLFCDYVIEMSHRF